MSDNEDTFSNDDFEESLNEELDRPRNQFILDEAESSGGEDEEFYEDEEEVEMADDDYESSAKRKPIPKRKREPEMDAETIAARFEAKYGGQQYEEQQLYAPLDGGTSNMKYYPRSLLMPERNDPSLFVVKCVPGREASIILALVKNPQQILSCFYRDHIKGYIYVEAYQKQHVVQAVEPVPYALRKCVVVPLTEMPQCLRDNKEENVIQGMWVRCKRGKYKMDIARIVAVSPSRESVRIQLIPRLDTSEIELDENGKRIKSNKRPKAHKFDIKDIPSYLKKQITRNNRGYFVLNSDSFKDGYLEKEIKVSNILLDARPTRREISDFYQKLGQLDVLLDDQTIDQLRQSEQSMVKAGDLVVVVVGELLNLEGKVESVERKLAAIKLLKDIDHGPRRNDILHFPVDHISKTFSKGSHVKVLVGPRRNETGMVVLCNAAHVTVLLDGTYDQIDVLSHELAEAFDISNNKPQTTTNGAISQKSNNFNIYDLLKFFKGGLVLYGCILQMVNDQYVILSQFNQTETIYKSQILEHRKRKATSIKIGNMIDGHVTRDVQFRAIINGDTVKSVLPNDSRDGTCIHIHRNYVWVLGSNKIVFVTHGENLKLVGGVFRALLHNDQQLNFDEFKSRVIEQPAGEQPENTKESYHAKMKMMGQKTKIKKGPWRGYIGTIKDVIGGQVRIILHTNSKTVDVPLSYIQEDVSITSQAPQMMHQDQQQWSSQTPGNQTPSQWGTTPGGNQTPGGAWGTTPGTEIERQPQVPFEPIKQQLPVQQEDEEMLDVSNETSDALSIPELKKLGLATDILLEYKDLIISADEITLAYIRGRVVILDGNTMVFKEDIEAPLGEVKIKSANEKGQKCKLVTDDQFYGAIGEVFTQNKNELVIKTSDVGYRVVAVSKVARLVEA